MTTPTREQVVQWSGDAFKNSSDYWNYMAKFATLARADLEAELESLRKDAESLKLLGSVTNGQVVWLNTNPHGWPEGTTFYAIAAAPKQEK